MQVFLPYPDFQKSVKVLDTKRLGKQRVEAFQLLNAIESGRGWSQHPAAVMFRQYVPALRWYGSLCCAEWIRRGFKDSLACEFYHDTVTLPWWVGGPLHKTHRSNLVRKYPGYYTNFFSEGPDPEYFWPTASPPSGFDPSRVQTDWTT